MEQSDHLKHRCNT